ncbi:MAG TPA: hypothetical protein VEC12_00620 [Bacteroidia bacterium]|nr:hypothetical protein [Bacteroidia bacterium]
MIKGIATVLFLACMTVCYAQGFSVNVSAGALHASSYIEDLSFSNDLDGVNLKTEQLNTYPWSGRKEFIRLPGNYFSAAVSYGFTKNHAIEVGYQYQQLGIRTNITTDVHGMREEHHPSEVFFNNALQINYQYSLWSKKRPMRIIFSGGIGATQAYGYDFKGQGYEAPSENYHRHVNVYGSDGPCFNIGVAGGIRVFRVLEAGAKINFIISFPSYHMYSSDDTPNTSFYYYMGLSNYFYTAGFYLRYNFKR